MYTGEADWTLIKQVKENPRIHIPIIGNGDIDSAEKALNAFQEFNVDAVMVGRASFGRPWIFREIRQYIDHGTLPDDMTLEWKMDVLKRQIRESVECSLKRTDNPRKATELGGIMHVRRHLASSPIFKGIPDFRQIRIKILRAETMEELFDLMNQAEIMIKKH
jgi:tRNA-dihydrouridine synthase